MPRTFIATALEDVLPPYVDGGCLSRRDVAAALLAPALPMAWNAPRIGRVHRLAAVQPWAENSEEMYVGPYDGTVDAVQRMAAYLAAHLAGDLVGAFVHGSLGTDEVVAYSDFDAGVILKDEVFAAPRRLARAAHRLYRAQALMRAYDPLQHHGWFVLAECQLARMPAHYLPPAVLQHAQALWPAAGFSVRVAPHTDPDRLRRALARLAGSIAGPLALGRYPQTLYALKGLLSRFMLLPARYVQARDGRGVFKRESFAAARRDFDPAVWAVMDEVSDLRASWAPLLTPAQQWWHRRGGPLRARVLRRWGAPITPALACHLTAGFYARMQRLAEAMTTPQPIRHRPVAAVPGG